MFSAYPLIIFFIHVNFAENGSVFIFGERGIDKLVCPISSD